MKDEALRMALEALEQLQGGCTDHDDGTVEAITVWCPEVIDAINQALAAPVQEPVATIDSLEQEMYEHTREFVSLNVMEWLLKRLNTTPPAARQTIPDAMTSADIQEHIEYVAGWNDCRQAMMEMMK